MGKEKVYNIKIAPEGCQKTEEFKELVTKEVANFLINSLPIEYIKAIVDYYERGEKFETK